MIRWVEIINMIDEMVLVLDPWLLFCNRNLSYIFESETHGYVKCPHTIHIQLLLTTLLLLVLRT